MTMTGGTVSVGTWLLVGGGGFASFNQSGGVLSTNTNNDWFDVGCVLNSVVTDVASFSGTATANLTTGGNSGIYMGQNDSGATSIVNISGSAAVNAGAVNFGNTAGTWAS